MINIKAFALTCGIFWAASLILIAALTMKAGLGLSFVNMVSEVYLGYGPTPVGAVIGAVWGFLDGLVCGAIFAWLYNKIAG
ncbi:MAG: bacteriophage holin [Candidatus Peribacter sp.]|nr:bacteriophage holin [Candidatus Peribacter sp.]